MLISCTICSDLFTGNDSESICCTPCGHMFHYICLMNWFERVKSCPQCRQRASENNIVRMFLSLGTSGGDDEEAPEKLKNRLDNLTYQIRLKDLDIKNLKEENEKFKSQNKNLLAHVKEVEDQIRLNNTVVKSMQDQVKLMKAECKELSLKRLEVEEYKKKIESLKNVQRLLDGSQEECEEVLKENKLNHNHLVRSLNLFKRESVDLRKKLTSLKEDRASREKKLNELVSKLAVMKSDYRNTLAIKTRLEEDLEHAEKELVKWKNNCLTLQKTNESLTNANSPKSNLRKRMIFESPAPANLIGRNLDSDSPFNVTTYDITTPSPVEAPKVRPFMSKLAGEGASSCSSSLLQASTSSSSTSSSSSIKSPRSTSSINTVLSDNSSNRSFGRANRFTADPWKNIGIIQGCTAGPDKVYDGLGGHSKVDLFPQPKLGPLVKKKKVSNLKVQCKKQKVDKDLPKISSFLKTYDLTGESDDEVL
ncbi:unnamed protein product [Bemisia tabaci]|uniref:RING-type domain-containing protein n=1 Tax=Bemisia tabaci TaxID=7038 RepID=A0A9P0A9B3_BEMTA|nr:unnamed protein product [Bemisia tabaci]